MRKGIYLFEHSVVPFEGSKVNKKRAESLQTPHYAYAYISLDGTVSTFPKQASEEHPYSLKRFPYLVLHFPSKQILYENQERGRSNVCKQVCLRMFDSVLSDRGEGPAELEALR